MNKYQEALRKKYYNFNGFGRPVLLIDEELQILLPRISK